MSAPAPLRRGPADPDAAEQIRTRILDAATELLLEVGVTGRLHAQIAQRSGLSRPTVYKYAGDQAAILSAVFEREVGLFLDAVIPQLRAGVNKRTDLLDGVVLVVEYARQHQLLQKALREQPEFILPALTTEAGPLMAQMGAIFREPLGHVLGGRKQRADVATEWLFRMVVSLIVTPGSAGDSPRSLRRYIDGLIDLVSDEF